MDQNISTPWAVAVLVVVLAALGVVVWRGMAPKAPPASVGQVYGPGGHWGPRPVPPPQGRP